MSRRLVKRPAKFWLAVALASLAMAPTPGVAQGLWGDLFGSPPARRPVETPCVLDKCLNGAAQKPASTAPAPTATDGAAPTIAPGNFDFYLLALSWSPGFCATGGEAKSPDQCAAGSGLGFVVHGLWPQFDHGYPSDCDANPRPVSRMALEATHGVFPSESLARYEWRKHGTCTGLSPEAFFASAKRARDSIVIPEAYRSPHEAQTLAPRDIARAFAGANPGLRPEAMAVGCTRGELEEVRLCLSKDLRQFVNCPEVARASCRAPEVIMAPVR